MAEFDFNQLHGQADNSAAHIYAPGEYDAVVAEATYGHSRDGKGQWVVRWRTTTGPDAGRVAIRQYLTISPESPQALGILFRQLEAMGIPADWVKTNPGEEVIAQYMVGRTATIVIRADSYEGMPQHKIAALKPARQGAPTDWPRQQPGAAGMPGAPMGYPQPAAAPGPYGAPAGGFPGQVGGAAPQPQFPGQPAMPQQQGYPPQPQFPGQPAMPQQPGPAYGPSGFAPPQQPGGPSAYSPVAAQQAAMAPPAPVGAPGQSEFPPQAPASPQQPGYGQQPAYGGAPQAQPAGQPHQQMAPPQPPQPPFAPQGAPGQPPQQFPPQPPAGPPAAPGQEQQQFPQSQQPGAAPAPPWAS